jgi:hypothetical protein
MTVAGTAVRNFAGHMIISAVEAVHVIGVNGLA